MAIEKFCKLLRSAINDEKAAGVKDYPELWSAAQNAKMKGEIDARDMVIIDASIASIIDDERAHNERLKNIDRDVCRLRGK